MGEIECGYDRVGCCASIVRAGAVRASEGYERYNVPTCTRETSDTCAYMRAIKKNSAQSFTPLLSERNANVLVTESQPRCKAGRARGLERRRTRSLTRQPSEASERGRVERIKNITLNGGSLGSWFDEERSQLRVDM